MFKFACPICQSSLDQRSPDELVCARDGATFRCVDGVWQFLRADRIAHYEKFIREYETVRAKEERGSNDSAYYRALPFADLTGRFTNDWQIRAISFRALIAKLALAEPTTPFKILDLGSGNGWLSYQLTKLGHTVAAIDLLTNARDGLGAHVHYDRSFTPIQSEFDHLPLASNQVDLAIFNSSFHYSIDYATTLRETLRVVNHQGTIVILDSPIYHAATSGAQMVAERQAQFLRAYGFPSNSIASENYLTFERLEILGRELSVAWTTIKPFRGWRWMMRPWVARLRRQREPAEFLVIIGKRKQNSK